MSARRPRGGREHAATTAISRRRFVSLLAAGSAALAASGALAAKPAPGKRSKPAAPPASKPASSATALQKEFDRQRAGTLDTLKTLRKFPLPPGGDLPVVFRPLRPTRKER